MRVLGTYLDDAVVHFEAGNAGRRVRIYVVDEFIIVLLRVQVETELNEIGSFAQVAETRLGRTRHSERMVDAETEWASVRTDYTKRELIMNGFRSR